MIVYPPELISQPILTALQSGFVFGLIDNAVFLK
jgi:hypothetical protein